MKKTIITIVATMLVTASVMGAYIVNVTEKYEAKLEETSREYESEIQTVQNAYTKAVKEKAEVETQIDELEEQVYNIFNKEPYEVTTHHDGVTYVYMSENSSIFSRLKVATIK